MATGDDYDGELAYKKQVMWLREAAIEIRAKRTGPVMLELRSDEEREIVATALDTRAAILGASREGGIKWPTT